MDGDSHGFRPALQGFLHQHVRLGVLVRESFPGEKTLQENAQAPGRKIHLAVSHPRYAGDIVQDHRHLFLVIERSQGFPVRHELRSARVRRFGNVLEGDFEIGLSNASEGFVEAGTIIAEADCLVMFRSEQEGVAGKVFPGDSPKQLGVASEGREQKQSDEQGALCVSHIAKIELFIEKQKIQSTKQARKAKANPGRQAIKNFKKVFVFKIFSYLASEKLVSSGTHHNS